MRGRKGGREWEMEERGSEQVKEYTAYCCCYLTTTAIANVIHEITNNIIMHTLYLVHSVCK